MRLAAPRILERIQKGTLASGYMLIGAELYWRDQICNALQKYAGLEAGSFGLAEFDLRHDMLEKVLEYAQERSLLAPRQLLFVKNAQALLARRTKDAESSADAEDSSGAPASSGKRSDTLAAYFQDPNPSSTIVFEMLDVDFESDDWREKEKAKSRVEAFEGVCEVALLMAPSFDEALELVRRIAADRHHKITPEAAEQLVSAFHRNMGVIDKELEKLCLYHPETGVIDLEDVRQLSGGASPHTTLGLTDAIGGRDATRSLEILQAIRRNGRYVPLVIAEIARYLRQLVLLKESKARDPRQAAKVLWDAKLGAPTGVIPALLQQARAFTGTELLRGLKLSFDADLALRSSPPDEMLVLEQLVLELVSPSRTSAKSA